MDHLEKTAIDEVVESEMEVKATGVVDQEVIDEVSEPVEAVEAEKQKVADQKSESSTIEDRFKGEMGTLEEVDLFLSDR